MPAERMSIMDHVAGKESEVRPEQIRNIARSPCFSAPCFKKNTELKRKKKSLREGTGGG